MKCRYCKEKAIIEYPLPLCKRHFEEYYLRKIKKTIEKYRMFTKEDKILVAVSGGKDSSALAYALYKLGYKFEGLYINLEIPDYSDKCEDSVKKLFNRIGYRLNIIRVSDYNVKVQRVKNRPVCSVCGIIKRYLMNKFAYENNFTVLATAHNLIDEASFFMMNFKSGQVEYILKQKPVLEAGPKLIKKVRPLFFLTEKENMLFCLINNLPVCHLECPYSKGNPQVKWKKILYKIEEEDKGFIVNFVNTMLRLSKIERKKEEEWEFCKVCGYPTTSKNKICSFCKIREYFTSKP